MKEDMNRHEFQTPMEGPFEASISTSSRGDGEQAHAQAMVPKREFGNRGVKISRLCLGGGSFTGPDSEALLDEALKHGVDCWEIVSFTGKAYGQYFEKHPEIREKVFLSAKVYSANPAVMQEQLEKTLKDNGTSGVDFLAIHVLDNIDALSDDVRKWVETAKKQKKIRFFGFCTHKSMPKCLSGAADLGWIDGIQTVYNYRLQSDRAMEDAVQKCHDKGIGIFAIKSMGLCVRPETAPRFGLTDREMSFEQAKLGAIWRNPNVTSICSLMPNSITLQSNVSAAVDERPLNDEIKKRLTDHAESTGRYFCRRCGACDAANADKIPIFKIMELLMYAKRYGMGDFAMRRFAEIPSEVRSNIPSSDYSAAERNCPQKMPVAQLVKEANTLLGSHSPTRQSGA